MSQDNTLHVYAPGADTVDILRRWDNRLPALSYTWGGKTATVLGKRVGIRM